METLVTTPWSGRLLALAGYLLDKNGLRAQVVVDMKFDSTRQESDENHYYLEMIKDSLILGNAASSKAYIE